MKQLPNLLSWSRIFLTFVVLYLFLKVYILQAFYVYSLATFTDLLDGLCARMLNATSKFGKIIDPLADKVSQITTFSLLVIYIGDIVLWILYALMISFAIILISLGTIAKYFPSKSYKLGSNWFGKGKMWFEFFSAVFLFNFVIIKEHHILFLPIDINDSLLYGKVLLGISVFLAIMSIKNHLKSAR